MKRPQNQKDNSKIIKIKVIPRSKKRGIFFLSEEAGYEVRVGSSPIKGEANREMMEIVSEEFKVAKSNIIIIAGKNGRNKIIKIES